MLGWLDAWMKFNVSFRHCYGDSVLINQLDIGICPHRSNACRIRTRHHCARNRASDCTTSKQVPRYEIVHDDTVDIFVILQLSWVYVTLYYSSWHGIVVCLCEKLS